MNTFDDVFQLDVVLHMNVNNGDSAVFVILFVFCYTAECGGKCFKNRENHIFFNNMHI